VNADSVGDSLAAHFVTRMAAQEATVQVVYANARPLTALPNSQTGEWVRYSWHPAFDAPAALGGLLHRGVGIVVVEIFTPLGTGQGRAERISRSVQTAFRDYSIVSGVRCKRESFTHQGEVDGWYKSTVHVEIEADEMV